MWNLFRNVLGNILCNMLKKRSKIKKKMMAEKKIIKMKIDLTPVESSCI